MDNIQEQDGKLLSSNPLAPKWLSIVFKIYGAFALTAAVFGVAMLVAITSFGLLTSLLEISLIVFGTALSSFILAYGCWKLKRWVIPILAFIAISGLFYFFQDSPVQSISSSVISIVFFAIAIFYRRYFTEYYRSYSMQGLYIFGFILIITASILPIFTGSLSDTKAEFQTAYSLHDIRQYSLGLELYYSDNNQYSENLNILENSGYVLPQAIDSVSNTNRKIDYCITSDKQNYAIGAPVSDSFGNIMEDSVGQTDLSCDLGTDKICGEDGYYCEVGFMPSSSGGVATADIEEIGMTFKYPSYWGDANYQIRQGWEGAGFSVYIFFSNFDRVSLGGNSRDYSYPRGATMFDFSGLDEINPYEFITSHQSCEDFVSNINYSDSMFINLLGCKNINISEDGLNTKAFDYFVTYNWTDEPNTIFRPGLHRIVESNIPNNVGGLRIIFDLDTPVYPIEELKLSIEKPENLIENKSEILDFYKEIVYGLQLEVVDDNLLQLNNEFTDLVSSIRFR